ncbi:MAG: NGG1p interacting factor NIF3 [Candidatus Eisenbacteria bacterium]|nr:NGG1p interacting factor NIF3 [Candidatus Eisenbacteria bacterium]
MRIGEFYRKCIAAGIAADPRGKKGVSELLNREKKSYEKLEKYEKDHYDLERLKNPYADVRILWGDEKKTIKRIMVGIDALGPEIMLASELGRVGRKVDLVLSHHPAGLALKKLPDVMDIHTEQWIRFGVPPHIAQSLTDERVEWAVREFHVRNTDAPVDIARLVGMPLMCCHTAADNNAANYLQKKIDKAKPRTVGDTLELVRDEPEYRHQAKLQAPAMIIAGKKDNRCGKVFVEMTGGIMPKDEAISELSKRGISTLVVMHMPEKSVEKAKEEKINVILAGHMASDTLGMNLVLDSVLQRDVEVLECAGFKRLERSRRK